MKPKLSTITKEEFDALSQAEQTVIVCRDVIAALDLEVIVAQNGTYADWRDDNEMPPFDVCDILDRASPGLCHVCAKGAAVLAVARITRNCDIPFIEVADDYGRASEALCPVFGQLADRMEHAFESPRHPFAETATSEARLRLVMQNIIDHGGNLVLDDPEAVPA